MNATIIVFVVIVVFTYLFSRISSQQAELNKKKKEKLEEEKKARNRQMRPASLAVDQTSQPPSKTKKAVLWKEPIKEMSSPELSPIDEELGVNSSSRDATPSVHNWQEGGSDEISSSDGDEDDDSDDFDDISEHGSDDVSVSDESAQKVPMGSQEKGSENGSSDNRFGSTSVPDEDPLGRADSIEEGRPPPFTIHSWYDQSDLLENPPEMGTVGPFIPIDMSSPWLAPRQRKHFILDNPPSDGVYLVPPVEYQAVPVPVPESFLDYSQSNNLPIEYHASTNYIQDIPVDQSSFLLSFHPPESVATFMSFQAAPPDFPPTTDFYPAPFLPADPPQDQFPIENPTNYDNNYLFYSNCNNSNTVSNHNHDYDTEDGGAWEVNYHPQPSDH
jgi:hypothetical protein